MYEEHGDFTAPHPDAMLWRYMDFTKFVSLLEKKAMFFPRADKLGEPFEGSFSMANKLLRPILNKKIPPEAMSNLMQFKKRLPRFTLISCWHENSHESEAMWKLYSRETDGIAIKTNFNELKNSLTCDEKIYIGKVTYADYTRDFIPEINVFSPYLHKRKSFEHEKEVRAIVQIWPSKDGKIDLSQDIFDTGEYYEVDLSNLIQEVIVAPFAQGWFLELVEKVAARYIPDKRVARSSLADSPIWD